LCINTQPIENHCELIDQSDIEVSLGVFNDFCGFGDFNAAGFVSADYHNLAIELIDIFSDFGGGTRSDFNDVMNATLFVARVNSFRAISGKKILIEF